jgi:hypothetical protein
MELVLVYLGPDIPKYVINNLILLRQQFPDKKIVLLSDNSAVVRKLSK